MRIIALATLCVLATLPAQAQQVDRIKASGANAAGACAGSLDMIGRYINEGDNPDPNRIAEVQQARNFFADLPLYPAAEIASAANAFVGLMVGRLQKAGSIAERQAIEREIMEISIKCSASANAAIRARMEATGGVVPAAPGTASGTVQPYVAPGATQPYVAPPAPAAQPYVEQPSIATQPYTTQPLLLDPIVPVQ